MKHPSYYSKKSGISLAFISIISCLLISACNNSKTNNKQVVGDSTTAVTPTIDTSKSFAGVKFPTFEITYKALKDLPDGIVTDKPKLLLLTGFVNIRDYQTMKLYPYFTKTHGHYAEKEVPLTGIVTAGTDMSEELPENLIIGNNDLVLKKILKKNGTWRNCDHFIFVPIAKKVGSDPNYHLAFKVIAVSVKVSATGEKSFLFDDAGESNPCPPAKPSED